MHLSLPKQSTAVTLLALMGLVGGLGSSLHVLLPYAGGHLGCWWHNAPCGAPRGNLVDVSPAATAENLSVQPDGYATLEQGRQIDDGSCPVCTLLARFHSAPASRFHFTPQPSLASEATCRVTLCIVLEPPSNHRPRGPPLTA